MVNELLFAAEGTADGRTVELMTESGRRAYRLLAAFGKKSGLDGEYRLLAPVGGISPAEVYCVALGDDGDVYAAKEDDPAVIAVIYKLYENASDVKKTP